MISGLKNVEDVHHKIVDFKALFESANKPVIFLSHNVPFNTRVDMITWEGSPRKGQHFGSLIAREACDKYQPVVCIGGHMHEHYAIKCTRQGGDFTVRQQQTKGYVK